MKAPRHLRLMRLAIRFPSEMEPELPLDPPELVEAIEDFIEFREEIKRPLTSVAHRLLLRKLRSWKTKDAVRALETSIEMNWAGVFKPKDKGGAFIMEALPDLPNATPLTDEERRETIAELKKFRA